MFENRPFKIKRVPPDTGTPDRVGKKMNPPTNIRQGTNILIETKD